MNHQTLQLMKKILLIAAALFFTMSLFAQTNGSPIIQNNDAIKGGVGLGTIIAVVASWSRNESLLWAILHGILGWFYVIYFAVTREEQ